MREGRRETKDNRNRKRDRHRRAGIVWRRETGNETETGVRETAGHRETSIDHKEQTGRKAKEHE